MVKLTSQVNRGAVFGRNHWQKNRRKPLDPDKTNVTLKERTPMRLRNYVLSSKASFRDSACIDEMLELLTCMKFNEFDEKNCPDQLSKFQNCFDLFKEKTRKQAGLEDKSNLIPYSKNLNTLQLNELLKKYPQKIDI